MLNRVFKPVELKLDMHLKRCTRMKANRLVLMPGGRTAKEEAILTMRQDQLNKTFTE